VVRNTPQPHIIPWKDPVPIVQEAGWAPWPVWTGVENLATSGFDPRTVQPIAQSLYQLSYPAHTNSSWPMEFKSRHHNGVDCSATVLYEECTLCGPRTQNFVNCLFSATGDSVACLTSLKTLKHVLRKVHSLFQGEFPTELDIMLSLSISSIFSFS
jgi:hypothetical protein